MADKQFLLGETEGFDEVLKSQDGVTLVGWTGTGSKKLTKLLMAASEAKQKDGIVHIDAHLLQLLVMEVLEQRLPADNNVAIGRQISWLSNRLDCGN